MRAVHLQLASEAGSDRKSMQGEVNWAAATGSHNLLLRGGEVGEPDNARSEPRRVLKGSSFSWRDANRASSGRVWLLVLVYPIKDPDSKKKAYPTPIGRRHDGPLGADPLCAYDAIAVVWWRRAGGAAPFLVDSKGCPADGWWLRGTHTAFLHQPFFTQPSGTTWRTEDSRKLYKAIVLAAGGDPSTKAARIGASTDAKERTEAGKAIIKRRGRWSTDVAEVYQRELLGIQLGLSMALGESVGEDLEELCFGWNQPTHT